jgi:hypothetical protein
VALGADDIADHPREIAAARIEFADRHSGPDAGEGECLGRLPQRIGLAVIGWPRRVCDRLCENAGGLGRARDWRRQNGDECQGSKIAHVEPSAYETNCGSLSVSGGSSNGVSTGGGYAAADR